MADGATAEAMNVRALARCVERDLEAISQLFVAARDNRGMTLENLPEQTAVSAFDANDEHWMRRALELAAHAASADGEVPVGAVLVRDNALIGEGWNRNITLNDPSAHAEILAMRAAGAHVGNYRFPGATLYATLEPCAMCAMALVHARIARVVYAATDPKTGAAGSVFDTLISDRHNHRIEVNQGLFANESANLLRAFFRARR